MTALATSYPGFILLFHFPISALAAFIALIAACKGHRKLALGFSLAAIGITAYAVHSDYQEYGWRSFETPQGKIEPFTLSLLTPGAVAAFILLSFLFRRVKSREPA